MENSKNESLNIEIPSDNIGTASVSALLDSVKNMPIFTDEHMKFLVSNSEKIGTVMEKSQMWRTDYEKKSILNDMDYPSDHSKFHQAILEQKVQFDQTMCLAKDYEMLQLDIQMLECEIDDLQMQRGNKRSDIEIKKKALEINFSKYKLSQMKIAMEYRMSECMGWQAIIDELHTRLSDSGMPENIIWDKGSGQIISVFITAINKVTRISTNTDINTVRDIQALASFSFIQVLNKGIIAPLYQELTLNAKEATKKIAALNGLEDKLDNALAEYTHNVVMPELVKGISDEE